MKSKLGTPERADLADVLPYLYGNLDTDWTSNPDADRAVAIPVSKVLNVPWNEGRLQRAVEGLAAGVRFPPIDVTRVVAGRRVFYQVSDGMHRTEAHRLAGRKTIRAEVSGTMVCPLKSFHLGAAYLAQYTPQLTRVAVWVHDLTPQNVAALRWLLAN